MPLIWAPHPDVRATLTINFTVKIHRLRGTREDTQSIVVAESCRPEDESIIALPRVLSWISESAAGRSWTGVHGPPR